jgi:hypothetical protein
VCRTEKLSARGDTGLPRTAFAESTLEADAFVRSDFGLTMVARVLPGQPSRPSDVALEIVAPFGSASY